MSVVDTYETLDLWYESIKGEKELTLKEAKELVQDIKECSSSKKKELLQEKLLTGTIGEAYKFIKSNGLLALCDTGYFEFDDLVSALSLTWAENLEDNISRVGRYSTMFSREFFERVTDRLGISNHSELLGMKNATYFDGLAIYFRERNMHDGSACEMPNAFVSSFSNSNSRDSYLKSIDFIDRAYARYREYGHVYSNHSGVCGLLGMAFIQIEANERVYDVLRDNSFLDELVEKIGIEEVVFGSKILTDEQKRALYYKYGFDGAEERTNDDLAVCMGLEYEKARNHLERGLLKSRKDGHILMYYLDRPKVK